MPRTLLSIDHHDSRSITPLVPMLGGLMAVLVWFGVWWDLGLAQDLLPSILHNLPRGAEVSQTVAATMMAIGVAGVAVVLMSVTRRYRKVLAELRLREAELQGSRDTLRRYVADLERISDVTSHDLQEPLRRMVAYAQLLDQYERMPLDDEARGYLRHVVDGARRMKALVSGLQSFVEVDSLVAPVELVGASQALSQARRRLADHLAAAGVALVVDPLPDVVADSASLVEIFVQLIDNAVRFRADGRRSVIHVSAHRIGGAVTFKVRDNGIGIEPGRVARMFEILHRPQDCATSSRAGIGMGLAVVRRLVERLGGVVWVESEQGKGSTFGFTLPAGIGATAGAMPSGREVRAA